MTIEGNMVLGKENAWCGESGYSAVESIVASSSAPLIIDADGENRVAVV
jgi:hypothetical protein